MKKPLLIEIGVEELPAIPFLKELPHIKDKWQKILDENKLSCDFEFFYTPRRLVLWHREFPAKQEDATIEMFGAPVEIAFQEGEPTAAALGFAKKCGVSVEELERSKKGQKEVLYFKKRVAGEESKKLLDKMIENFLQTLNFGKSMRWGDSGYLFIRPVRTLSVMMGEDIIDMELYGVKSSNKSAPHRSLSYDLFEHNGAGDYFCKLSKNGVILNPKEREALILEQFKKIEQNNQISIDIDKELLAEVVAITENPHSLIGEFDAKFLKLPSEVIILSMREHQRYFPVFKDGILSNHFIVVSNSISDDYKEIIEGNQKVLRARLSDALFFWESDLKRGLSSDGLKDISFIENGGTLYDKVEREKEIAIYLNQKFSLGYEAKLLEDIFEIKNADLLTDMVYEFTELQGIMGSYYALAQGKSKEVALAIKEQYLPEGEDSSLPSSDLSAIIAMSLKLDTLLKLFSLNEIPTGTKDPFGLRRAVVGLIKIVLDRKFSFDLNNDLKALSSSYKDIDLKRLEEFFIERINQYFKTNPSIIKAVLESGERDILKISKKIEALDSISKREDFKEFTTTFKRVANIVKDMDLEEKSVDVALFVEAREKELYDDYRRVKDSRFRDYQERLEQLISLKEKIDNFFDDVMVNVEDSALKQNRKNLINNIYLAFREIADIKEITV